MKTEFTMIVLFLALFAGGCADVKRTETFNESDFVPFAQGGRDALDGNITIGEMGISGVFESGNIVTLTPATPYTTEWYEKQILAGQSMEPADPRLAKYQRKAPVDRNGDYHFDNLAPGDYFVTASILVASPFNPNQSVVRDLHARVTLNPPPRRARATTAPTT